MADVLIKEWDIGAMRRPAAGAPSASRTPGANFPWDALNFATSGNEAVFMFGTMPESDLYAASQSIAVEVSWVSDAASVGTVRWEFFILGRKTGEAWDVVFVDGASASSPRVAGNALHTISIPFGAPSLEPGDDFILRIRRANYHGEDNWPVDADLVRVRMYAA